MFVEFLQRARAYVFAPGFGPMFVRSLAGTGVVRMASMVATFAVGVQLARELGVAGYGYYGIALSIVTIGGIPGELGLSRLVTREVSAASVRHDYSVLFGVLRWAEKMCWLVSGIVCLVIATIAAVLMSRGSYVLGVAVLLGLATIPFMALSRIYGGALQGLQFITLGQIPANLVRPLLLSLMLFAAYFLGVMRPAVGMALNSIAAVFVFVLAKLWLSSRAPRKPAAPVKESRRKWLASTIPLALTDAMWMLQVELTTILVGALASPTGVSLFRIAVGTVGVAAAPFVVINNSAMPMIARLHAEGDKVRLQKVVTYCAWLQTGGVLVLCLPLILFPGFLLSLVFGHAFAAAAPAMMILAAAQIMSATFGPNVLLLNMTHQERRVTFAMTVGVTVNAALVLILAAKLGPVGAAIGVLSSMLCWNVLTWRDAKRYLGVETSIFALPARIRRASSAV